MKLHTGSDIRHCKKQRHECSKTSVIGTQPSPNKSEYECDVDVRIEDKECVAVVPRPIPGQKRTQTVGVKVIQCGMCCHGDDRDGISFGEVSGKEIHHRGKQQREDGN